MIEGREPLFLFLFFVILMTSTLNSIPLAVETIERLTLDKVSLIQFQNQHRHILIETERGLKFWMTFKGDWFLSFGKFFNLGASLGESINAEILEKVIVLNVSTILFIHGADIYAISPQEYKNYAEKFKTSRQTESGEVTMSVPQTLLRKI